MRLSGIMLLDFALVAFGYGLAVSWPLRPPKVRGSISVADVFRKSLVFRWLFARSRRAVARQVLLRSPPPRSGSAKLLLSFSLLRVFRPSLAACAIRFIFAVARLGVRDHSSKKRGVAVCFPTVAGVCDLRTCFFVRTLTPFLVFIVCVVGARRGSRGFFVDFGFRVACRSPFERKCAQCRWLFSLRHVHARNPVSPQFLVGGAVLVEASHALPLNLASHQESSRERALRPLCFPYLFSLVASVSTNFPFLFFKMFFSSWLFRGFILFRPGVYRRHCGRATLLQRQNCKSTLPLKRRRRCDRALFLFFVFLLALAV